MSINDIPRLHRDLTVMAFYQENGQYKVSMPKLETIFSRFDALFDEDTHGYAQLAKSAKESFEQFKYDLEELIIPEDAFTSYLKTKKPTIHIEHYQNIKEEFKRALIPLYVTQMRMPSGPSEPAKRQSHSSGNASQTILNRHNPFADIVIQNQSFLYPDSDGEFQTLRFNMGYTMTSVESEENESVVLTPSFAISKSRDRRLGHADILMADTITTKMSKNDGEKELLYI